MKIVEGLLQLPSPGAPPSSPPVPCRQLLPQKPQCPSTSWQVVISDHYCPFPFSFPSPHPQPQQSHLRLFRATTSIMPQEFTYKSSGTNKEARTGPHPLLWCSRGDGQLTRLAGQPLLCSGLRQRIQRIPLLQLGWFILLQQSQRLGKCPGGAGGRGRRRVAFPPVRVLTVLLFRDRPTTTTAPGARRTRRPVGTGILPGTVAATRAATAAAVKAAAAARTANNLKISLHGP